MKILSEIFSALAADGLEIARISYTVVDGRGGYFQNVKRLLEFSEDAVVLGGKKGRVRVTGKGLSLGKCTAGDVTVLGDIAGVVREEGE